MPLSNLLVILGVTCFLLVLAMFPSFRNGLKVLLGGFLNLFIEDTAKSPKGAAAIFDKAIEEAQDKYNKADDTLRSITGRLDAVMKQRDEAARLVKEYEEKARRAMAHGREDDARLYAEKRQDAIISYDQYSKAYEQLIPVVKQAKDIYVQRQTYLKDIQHKKRIKIEQLKTNQDIEEAFDDLDDLKKDTSTKKLLGIIDEEIEAGAERAAGARIVHEAKLETRIARADKKSESYAVDDFLDSLRTPQLSSSSSRPTINIVTPQKTTKK